MTVFDKVLQAAWVVSMAGDPVKDGWVAVKDGKVAGVGAGEAPEAGELQVIENGVILPGLINAHTHLGCSFLDAGNSPDEDVDFLKWIDENVTPHVMEAFLGDNADEARPKVLIAAVDAANTMLRSGTTTVVDSFFDSIGYEVLTHLGMRGLFCREYFGSRSEDLGDYVEEMKTRTRQDLVRFNSNNVGFGLAPHALYSCPRDVLVEVFGEAKDRNLPLTIHVAESPVEAEFFIHGLGPMKELFAPGEKKERYNLGKSPVRMMHELGLLHPGVILVHMVQVDEADLDLVAASGAGIVHCPASNATLQVGIAPVRKMLDRGIPVAIGTDSLASNTSVDIFDEMRFAMSLDHDGGAGLTAEEVLRMATTGAAGVCCMSKTAGTIEVGKVADLLVKTPAADEGQAPKEENLASWIVSQDSRTESVHIGGNETWSRT